MSKSCGVVVSLTTSPTSTRCNHATIELTSKCWQFKCLGNKDLEATKYYEMSALVHMYYHHARTWNHLEYVFMNPPVQNKNHKELEKIDKSNFVTLT
jgi:hypothetical protein